MKHEPNIHIRGKRPVSFTPCGCACCGDYPLDTEDMASTKHFTEDRLTLLTAAYSGPQRLAYSDLQRLAYSGWLTAAG